MSGVAISAKGLYHQMLAKPRNTHALDVINTRQTARRVYQQIDHFATAAFIARRRFDFHKRAHERFNVVLSLAKPVQDLPRERS